MGAKALSGKYIQLFLIVAKGVEMAKILFLGNCYTTVVHFRKEVIQEFIRLGYEVWISFPNHSHGEPESGEQAANELGCNYIELGIERRSKNILRELLALNNSREVLTKVNPDIVLTYTVKPNLYGGMICRKRKISYVLNVTGLGSGFNGGMLSHILFKAYLRVAKDAEMVFFQNTHDLDTFISNGYKFNNYKLISGSGVNTSFFTYQEYPTNEEIMFLYDARVMKEKGIEEFLYAAEFYKDSRIRFKVCGDCEEGYLKRLTELSSKHVIEYEGRVSDVRPYLNECSCVVIPSYYNEGISNCLLEAASCGRPIITSDHPGCRETVDNGVTGFIVTPRSKESVKNAIGIFIGMRYEEKKQMGIAGRRKIEQEFDRDRIIKEYIDVVNQILG